MYLQIHVQKSIKQQGGINKSLFRIVLQLILIISINYLEPHKVEVIS